MSAARETNEHANLDRIWPKRGPVGRVAYGAAPGYLEKVWREANGNAWMPNESDLRAFLMQLSHETEGGPR